MTRGERQASPKGRRHSRIRHNVNHSAVLNAVTADIDLEIVRESARRDRPFGTSGWTLETARALNLEYSLRSRGRPRGNARTTKDRIS